MCNSPFFIGKNLLADLDQIRARLHDAGGHDLDVLEIIGVRDDGNHHGGVSGSRDFVQIHLQQQIALLDLVALLDLRAEAVALHLDGVNADMDQHLNTGSGQDAQRVAAVGGLGDLTVRGGINFALGRVDAAALAQNALCKHLVGDVLHRHNGTLGISSQGHGEGWGRGGGRLGRLFRKSKKPIVKLSFISPVRRAYL